MEQFKYKFEKGYEKGNKLRPYLMILGLIFITLKLTNFIAWSWWLVLLPFYIGLAVIAAMLAFMWLIILIGVLFS